MKELQIEKQEKFLNSSSKQSSKRRVNLLELFFDLVIVAALSSISSIFIETIIHINEENNYFRVAFIIMELFLILAIWNDLSFHSANFKSDSWIIRIQTFLLMIPLIFVTISNFVPGGEFEFYLEIFSFVAGMILLGVFGYISNRHGSSKINLYYLYWIVGGLILLTTGIYQLFLVTFHSVQWWIIIIIIFSIFIFLYLVNLLLLMLYLQSQYKNFNTNIIQWRKNFNEKIVIERRSLLFLIFIGETIIILIDSIVKAEINPRTITIFMISLIWVFVLWIGFEKRFNDKKFKSLGWSLIYIFLSPFKFISLLIMSSAVGLWIEGDPIKASYLFFASVIVYIILWQSLIFCFNNNILVQSFLSIIWTVILLISNIIILIFNKNMWAIFIFNNLSFIFSLLHSSFLWKGNKNLKFLR